MKNYNTIKNNISLITGANVYAISFSFSFFCRETFPSREGMHMQFLIVAFYNDLITKKFCNNYAIIQTFFKNILCYNTNILQKQFIKNKHFHNLYKTLQL